MTVTPEMIEAARRAEYDYYQKGRMIGQGRFISTPDAVIRAMLEAALSKAPPAVELQGGKRPSIVSAKPPRRR